MFYCYEVLASKSRRSCKLCKNFNPDEIILMPLYPQYSAATSGSSIKEWKDICKKNNLKIKTSTICCYPTDENFVLAIKRKY